MASTRVLASRLASQMASASTKVARPALRIQSRTIATGKLSLARQFRRLGGVPGDETSIAARLGGNQSKFG